MRALYVFNIIKSHYESESAFYRAVKELIEDENKKGNNDFASKINDILINKSKSYNNYKNIIFKFL